MLQNNLNLPYRLGVGIILVNKDNKIFVGKRIDTRSEAWQMPQGGIDKGEKPKQAVMRELYEEVGIINAKIIKETENWYSYDIPDHLIAKLWNGKYRGQKQKWFLIRFLGNDDEINIHNKHAEFKEWKWTDIDEILEIIVPFKKELYKQIFKELKEYL